MRQSAKQLVNCKVRRSVPCDFCISFMTNGPHIGGNIGSSVMIGDKASKPPLQTRTGDQTKETLQHQRKARESQLGSQFAEIPSSSMNFL